MIDNCLGKSIGLCGYIDRTGEQCSFYTCIKHGKTIAGTHYCRRHSPVLDALGVESIDTIALPLLGNRNISLLSSVTIELDESIRALLQNHVQQHEHVEGDAHVSPTMTPKRKLFWHKTWSILSTKEPVIVVSIGASDDIDAQIMITVNDIPLSTGVPAWIQRRKDGGSIRAESAELEHQLYCDFVLEIIQQGIARFRPDATFNPPRDT